MRETSDMMEDAMSEDTMMDCGVDGNGLDDLVDLATDISDAAPTIRDAAERLLTLLGVEDSDDDDLLSSSEDEGVDLDDEDSDDDSDDPINTRLLHQLAASLAEELKFAQKQSPLPSKVQQPCNRATQEDPIQRMEVQHEVNTQGINLDGKFGTTYYCAEPQSNSEVVPQLQTSKCTDFVPNKRCRLDQHCRIDEPEEKKVLEAPIPSSWGAGWDACAAEVVKYLIEVEGLSPQHPTVVALQSHLEMQRDRAFAQYTS